MAVKKELIINIAPDGNLRIKTEGFEGRECDEELKPIEKALGRVTSTEKSSEYYQQSHTQKGKLTNQTK